MNLRNTLIIHITMEPTKKEREGWRQKNTEERVDHGNDK